MNIRTARRRGSSGNGRQRAGRCPPPRRGVPAFPPDDVPVPRPEAPQPSSRTTSRALMWSSRGPYVTLAS